MAAASQGRLDLSRLLIRFPEDAGRIRRLVLESEMFRSICEDHYLASETLASLEDSAKTSGSDDGRIAEYRALVVDLEREISDMLENAKTSR